jgi:hypothetical protein
MRRRGAQVAVLALKDSSDCQRQQAMHAHTVKLEKSSFQKTKRAAIVRVESTKLTTKTKMQRARAALKENLLQIISSHVMIVLVDFFKMKQSK